MTASTIEGLTAQFHLRLENYNLAKAAYVNVLYDMVFTELCALYPTAVKVGTLGDYGEEFGGDDTLRVTSITLADGTEIDDEAVDSHWSEMEDACNYLLDELIGLTGDDWLGTHSHDVEDLPRRRSIDIVFDGPPGAESGRFVETETPEGKGIGVGEWVEQGDYWRLRITGTFDDIRES